MPLERFINFKIVSLLAFPKLDGHILRARSHALAVGMKVKVVHHTSMLSQSLLALSCLVIPDLYWCVFTATGNLGIVRMKTYFSHARTMTLQLKFLWLSWNCVSAIFILVIPDLLLSVWQSTAGLFYVLYIYLVLVVHLFQLFALSL